MNARKLLLFSRDPGGANQMIMVFRMLHDHAECGHVPDDPAMREFFDMLCNRGQIPEPLVYTKSYADRHWAEEGLDSHAWHDWATLAELSTWLVSEEIAAVVTGTSDVDDDTDQRLWRAAARCGIPSYAFLDHASNPVQRFLDGDGSIVHPGVIFLHDAETRDLLITAGIPATHLRMGTNLFLNAIQLVEDGQELRKQMRRGWGLGDDDTVILFASEPVAEVRSLGRTVLYDEFESIARVIRAIGNGERLLSLDCAQARISLVIRAHPRDRGGKYRAVVEAAPIPVYVNDKGRALDAILAADLVVGMDSSLLVEAQQLGVPVLSLVNDSMFSRLRGGPCDPNVGRGE